ncbi:MAG TPA: XdhC family protein [Actinomycetota bacterium]|nr:XdhC family protein [Actinomycetota bacterium]
MSGIVERAAELDNRGEPYVFATVVAVDRPVSARPGDRAIVDPRGRVEGWIGGSCSEPIVVREAMAALTDGNSRLVRIRPPGSPREPARPGVVTEITTCASEGGLDVFVEPRLARPHLVVAGSSPVTRTLADLAKVLGYRTSAVVDDPAEKVPGANAVESLDSFERIDLGPADAVVVATMNRYDEAALQSALETGAGYIGLVASRARAHNVMEMLRARGVDEAALGRIKSPAGFDLGPSAQEEIALAVMAEVVAERHRHGAEAEEAICPPDDQVVREAVDPVCGMTVPIVPGTVSAERGGVTFYFCNPGCRDEFLAHPDDYLQAVGQR